jgi:hypothetical protein
VELARGGREATTWPPLAAPRSKRSDAPPARARPLLALRAAELAAAAASAVLEERALGNAGRWRWRRRAARDASRRDTKAHKREFETNRPKLVLAKTLREFAQVHCEAGRE